MRLIDADELKKDIVENSIFLGGTDAIEVNCAKALIDIAPTVEYPEQITIKCDTEEDKQKLLSALRNAKLKAIVEDERPHGEWIPVSERLPEISKVVIVTDIETNDTYQSQYIGDGYWECDNGTFKNRIIAWMPLPEPYKEAKHDTK